MTYRLIDRIIDGLTDFKVMFCKLDTFLAKELLHFKYPLIMDMIDQPIDFQILGKSITLTCGASPTGYPAPKFTWWRDNEPATILSTGIQYRPLAGRSGTIGPGSTI